MAEVEKMNCENCGRSGKITRLLLHHVTPRELHGEDEQDNRLPLCTACERFIHFRYPNSVLAKLAEKVLQEKDVRLFGIFVNSPEYIRRADVRDIEKDFEEWKSKQRALLNIAEDRAVELRRLSRRVLEKARGA